MVYLLDIDFSLLLNFNNSHETAAYIPHCLTRQNSNSHWHDANKRFNFLLIFFLRHSAFFFFCKPYSLEKKIHHFLDAKANREKESGILR